VLRAEILLGLEEETRRENKKYRKRDTSRLGGEIAGEL
jgi:hypothetical protein